MSPVFEVFSTQIYTQSIMSNLTFGGARYIATGRGFATTRNSFSILYSRFAGPSIYMGLRLALMMAYVSSAFWINWFIYFWVTTFSLCLSPFLFNPHQFSFSDFMIDYREFLRWMSRGNSRHHANSWVGYCRLSRTKITGYKRKKLGHPSEKLASDVPRASWRTVIYAELLGPLCMAIIMTVPYLFVKSCVFSLPTCPLRSFIDPALVALLQVHCHRSPAGLWYPPNRRYFARTDRLQHGHPARPVPHLALPRTHAQQLLRQVRSDDGRRRARSLGRRSRCFL